MSAVRAGLTLLTAVIVLLGGTLIGFRMLTADADTTTPVASCKDRTIAKGESLTTNLITVNVFNASARAGLANRVTINLQRRGFLGGTIGNSTSAAKPKTVTILTDDKTDPRVRLVARQFADRVSYAKPDITVKDGVTVIVGDDYDNLRKAPIKVRADRDITVCVPVVALS